MRPFLLIVALLTVVCGCTSQTPGPPATTAAVSRLAAIPAGAGKVAPHEDAWPPVVAPGWSKPVPLGAPVNTAGAEDSPFVTPDGEALYFFFTPDLNVPAEEQLLDRVTGIWLARPAGEGWGEPEHLLLASLDELHLDGCPTVVGTWMVFCSARASNSREVDLYTATLRDGTWTDVQNWGEPFSTGYDVGEMHITADGSALYYSSARPGGLGWLDLWVSFRTGDGWGEPVNLGPRANTAADENRPFANGEELWFDAQSRQGLPGPAIFRASRHPDGSWSEPEEVVSSFAGEPSLTGDGRVLYFVHHYPSADMGRMIEADLYVTERLETE